ncbi:TIR domain-containing protein [Pseudonocardia lacus]|uniref:TIR domain-containing protein n=1 Tax=Pseudonocardia lacus TaxID=2835865 RepID=UPI001BDC998B|nr:TIR domain-containing protein [Pseudonocardia lacus]
MSTEDGLPGLVALAVDQDGVSLEVLVSGLEADSRIVRVLRARGTAEALTHLQSEPIDVVFTDTALPELSGMQLAQVVDAMAAAPPIVFVTEQEDQAVAAYEVGALDYVLKPAQPARLARSVDRVQAERGLRYIDRTPIEAGPAQVFLCHSADAEEPVRRLRDRLVADGVRCWLAAVDADPDRDLAPQVVAAVQRSRYVLACVSHRSVTDRGYLDEGLRTAVEAADAQPEGATFLVPVRLAPCPIPQRLARWHWVDLFTDFGYDRLRSALRIPRSG